MDKYDELINFCYSCIISGDSDDAPMTEADARYNMQAWRDEDEDLAELLDGVSPCEFSNIYNQVLNEIN